MYKMSDKTGIHAKKYPQVFYHYNGFENITQSLVQFKDEPLLSAPGTQINYSDFGFQVIGAVIELDMNSTFCESHEEIIFNMSRNYMRSDSQFLPKTKINCDSSKQWLRTTCGP